MTDADYKEELRSALTILISEFKYRTFGCFSLKSLEEMLQNLVEIDFHHGVKAKWGIPNGTILGRRRFTSSGDYRFIDFIGVSENHNVIKTKDEHGWIFTTCHVIHLGDELCLPADEK